jgi:putative ABC transport system substrate-binding protein
LQLLNVLTITREGNRLLFDSCSRVSFQQKIRSARLCGLLALLSVPVFAGPVLVLKGPNTAPYKEALNGFRQAYPGGTEIDFGKTRELLSRVRTDRPSLIVAIGRASAEAAHQQVPAIPLIFLMVAYPSESGLTGTNVAGISMDIPGSVQLAGFKQILPYPKKPVAVVYNPAKAAALVADAQSAAPGLELLLEPVPVDSAEHVAMRIALVKPIIGAIWIVPDESFATKEGDKWFNDLLRQTTASRLPLLITMNASSTFVEKGALAALVSDYFGMGRQCGELVKEIEAGKTKVETVGIKSPAAIAWQVNLSTAEKIGQTLPRTVLNSASPFH